MAISPYRAEFAATIFIRECLRQWLKQNPGVDPSDAPMKALCDYAPRDRQALINAVLKATEATTGMDDAYKVFIQMKLDETQAANQQSQAT
ncbi:hypothetical protein HGG70_05095 [Rhodobacteraceae bacterium R_SAG4]|nr:hypothetical protein [Rhodobacteraceae bacterium R_SAG4]